MPSLPPLDIPLHKLPSSMELGNGYGIGERVHRPLVGVRPDQVMHPDYFQHMALILKVNDRIEVLALDGSFDAELRVVHIGNNRVTTRALRFCDQRGVAVPDKADWLGEEATPDEADQDGFKVEWAGPAHRFRIIRGGDVIEIGLQTREAANARLAELKAERRAA